VNLQDTDLSESEIDSLIKALIAVRRTNTVNMVARTSVAQVAEALGFEHEASLLNDRANRGAYPALLRLLGERLAEIEAAAKEASRG